MRASLIIPAMAAALLASCGGEKNPRTLIDVVQPDADAAVNYAVFVWREPKSENPTIVYFGVAPLAQDGKTDAQTLATVEPFGSANFAASSVSYGWSGLKEFSVCAARSKQTPVKDKSVYSVVITNAHFSAKPDCTGAPYKSFPPAINE